jgi:hypothetical protein
MTATGYLDGDIVAVGFTELMYLFPQDDFDWNIRGQETSITNVLTINPPLPPPPPAPPSFQTSNAASDQFSTTSSGTITLSAPANSLLVLGVANEVTSGAVPIVTSITGTGLTWLQRSQGSTLTRGFEVWYAKTVAVVSSVIATITLSDDTDDASLTYFAVTGVNASAWDSNASLPAYAPGQSATTISTTAAKTLVVGWFTADNDTMFTAVSPYQALISIDNAGGVNWSDQYVFTNIFLSAQTNLVVSATPNGLPTDTMVDAIVAA